jgi:hypothetical protein
LLPADAESGSAASKQSSVSEAESRSLWGSSGFGFTQTASTETLGIGQDVQSRNPTYDWAFSLSPVAELYREEPWSFGLRADASLFREFTNSDGTTRRGEWLFGDVQVGASTRWLLHKQGLYSSALSLRAPTVTLPTSRASANNGTILGLGASLGLSQSLPLLGEGSSSFQSFSVSGSAGYSHTFTEAIVPTNPELQRIRLTPEGDAVPSDQLGVAAYAQHRASFVVGLGTQATDKLSLSTGMTWSPVWKYTFDDNVEVCNLATGCVQPDRVASPQHYSLIAGFNAAVALQLFDALGLSLGYSNVTLQLGPDVKRRQPFYSPSARVSLVASTTLEAMLRVMEPRPAPEVARK